MLLVIVIVVFAFWLYFATRAELGDQKNAYISSTPNDRDSIKSTLRKIKICLLTEQKTIKWRRVYIGALLSTALIYVFIHNRLPTSRELVLGFFITYLVYTFIWAHYHFTTTNTVVELGKKNLDKLDKYINSTGNNHRVLCHV